MNTMDCRAALLCSSEAGRICGAIALAAAGLLVAPISSSGQSMSGTASAPSFYFGLESGLNWMLNSDHNEYRTGFAMGGVAGIDLVGPRIELEVLYRTNPSSQTTFPGGGPSPSGQTNQLSTMVNALYDFAPKAVITPYAGLGLGVAFVDDKVPFGCSLCETKFAYQAIVGLGYNASPSVRLNLDARYYGTNAANTYSNNDLTIMAGATYKFGHP